MLKIFYKISQTKRIHGHEHIEIILSHIISHLKGEPIAIYTRYTIHLSIYIRYNIDK